MNSKLAIALATTVILGSVSGCVMNPNKTVSQNLSDDASDSVITGKIKAEYAKDKDVNATNIRVDTDNGGKVTLSGVVRSQTEANKAVSIAKGISGVTSVRNNIQVQPQ